LSCVPNILGHGTPQPCGGKRVTTRNSHRTQASRRCSQPGSANSTLLKGPNRPRPPASVIPPLCFRRSARLGWMEPRRRFSLPLVFSLSSLLISCWRLCPCRTPGGRGHYQRRQRHGEDATAADSFSPLADLCWYWWRTPSCRCPRYDDQGTDAWFI
jgi:hypothetical protein